MKKLKVKISGMHCASCASNVERSVKGIKGVKSCNVSAITSTAFIEAEDSVEEKEIEKAVARPGYKALKIEKT